MFFSSTSLKSSTEKPLRDFVDFNHTTMNDLKPRGTNHSFLNIVRITLTFHVKLKERNVHGNRPSKLKLCIQIKSC